KVMFTGTGISEQDLEPIKEAYRVGGEQKAAHHVTDEMVHIFGAVGTAEDVIKGLKRLSGTGLTFPLLWGPLGTNHRTAIKKLAEEVLPYIPLDNTESP
ncbi:MAG: hypothetical protein ACTSYO_04235, partial [Candidatus Ranarchaeia archaeon]